MNALVTIVDYGSGNLLSVSRALQHCGATVLISRNPADIESASRLVLPGVGAFADGMEGLRRFDLADPIRSFVASGRPLLGICLGMQMLASASEEFGEHEGLGLIPGRVVSIPDTSSDSIRLKRPHIGWSELQRHRGVSWHETILADTPEGTAVYSVHSFHFVPEDPAACLAQCSYGTHRLTAAVKSANVMGCQFHPEKSGPAGLRIIGRFLSC